MFCDSFWDTYKDNFTYEGKRALFDYLENLSEDIGEDIELDTVAICCDYTQFDDLEEYNSQYEPVESIDEIENLTQVIRIDGSESFIIQNY